MDNFIERVVSTLISEELLPASKALSAAKVLQEEFSDTFVDMWTPEGIKQEYPELTEEQVREVISYLEGNYDATYGISWQRVEFAMSQLGIY